MGIQKLITSLTVQVKWVIKLWEIFSKDWLVVDVGVVLMNLIDKSLKCYLCV